MGIAEQRSEFKGWNRFKIIKTLALIVVFTSVMVILGWILDIPVLTSILPQWVTMKFSTAFSFLISGLSVYFIVKYYYGEREMAQVILPLTAFVLLLLMGILLLSVIMGIRTGLEDLFVKEASGAVKTVTPGRPSIGTMINFILIGVASLVTMVSLTRKRRWLRYLGGAITAVGGIAVLGYFINVPLLYYTIENLSTAMAFHTALLFILTGIGIFLVSSKQEDATTDGKPANESRIHSFFRSLLQLFKKQDTPKTSTQKQNSKGEVQ